MNLTSKPRLQLVVLFVVAIFGFTFMKMPTASAQSETGSITLVTSSDPAGAVDFFYFGGLGSILLDDGESHQENRVPGDYQVYQSLPAGWVVDISCTGGNVEIGEGNVIIHLAAGDDIVCTFANTDIGGSITINTAGATDRFYFGGLGSFTQSDGDSRLSDNLMPGDYQIYQSVATGWTVDISCTGGDVTVGDGNVIVHLAANQDIVCTFNNINVGGSITILNASAGGSGFYYFGNLGSFSLDDGQSKASSDLLPGDYQIYQSIPQAWELAISCVGGDATISGDNVIVHLAANDGVVCTFSNSDIGSSITINTVSNPAGGSGYFYFGNAGSFTLDDGQSHTSDRLLPGDYQIYQSVPAGGTVDISCTGNAETGNGSVIVHLGSSEDVECTFSNSDLGGSITLVTTSDPAGTSDFYYFGGLGSFTQNDGDSKVSDNLLPGDYQIYQSVWAGWTLDISCSGGNVEIGNGDIIVHLGANEDVVCTFDNTDVGSSITIVNNADLDNGLEFTYFGNIGFFTLTAGGSRQSADLYPGEYEVIQGVPQGWLVDVSCTGGSVDIVDTTTTIHLGANEDIVCTFDNSYVGGSISFTNVAAPADGTEFVYFGNLGFHTFTSGQGHTAENLYPGDYEIIQNVVPDWALEVVCTGGDVTVTGGTATVHLGANENVSCDFVNTSTIVQTGSVTIVTDLMGPGSSLTANYSGDLGTFSQGRDDSQVVENLVSGDYQVVQAPLSGWVLSVNCVGGSATASSQGVTIHLNAGEDIVCTFVNRNKSVLFYDDFESNRGWAANAAGTDTATGGQWEWGTPETTKYGEKSFQTSRTTSGSRNLVTGAAAGSNVDSNDVDGGVTSIRSVSIEVPALKEDMVLTLKYYFAHLSNATNADYFRVSIVGETMTKVVLEERGNSDKVFSEWEKLETKVNAFGGQTIYILIETADNGSNSSIEAAVDDVMIKLP
ncbi:MAG: hypothetical protein H6668_04820 [Ardenticatenaceae bacterium]|nr:hypothetical protein [Ardenticatenaceae bacterium]